MKKILFFLFFFPAALHAQDLSIYAKKMLVQNGDTLPYRILLPENFNAKKKYPLVIFLHGAGERGNDNQAQLTHGGSFFTADSNRKKYPAIVVFPQCSAKSFWSNVEFRFDSGHRDFIFKDGGTPTPAMALLLQLTKKLQQDYKVEKRQIYVGGLSMGGMGTLEMVNRNPTLFAAAFAICGGADTSTAKNISKTPIWLFHGGKDDVVPPKYSINMADALLKLNANVKITIFPEANHNSWDSTFAEPGLLPWLFSNRKR